MIYVLSVESLVSPSIRYRILYPLDILGQQRIYVSFYDEATERAMHSGGSGQKIVRMVWKFVQAFRVLLLSPRPGDLVIVKNYFFPVFGAGLERLLYWRFRRCRVLFDIDDGNYLNSTSPENRLFSIFRDARAKIGFWVARADYVVASNETILDDLRRLFGIRPHCKTMTELTYTWKSAYFSFRDEIAPLKRASKQIIWLGSPHTQIYLGAWKDYLDQVLLDCDAELVLIGTSPQFPLWRDHPRVHRVAWSIETERRYMRTARYGINPLADGEFERRKSAFKVLQYYRAGIIPIVDDVGLNRALVAEYGGWVVGDKQTITFGIDVELNVRIFDTTADLSIEAYANRLEAFLELTRRKQ